MTEFDFEDMVSILLGGKPEYNELSPLDIDESLSQKLKIISLLIQIHSEYHMASRIWGTLAMSIRSEHSQFDTFSANFRLAAWHILSAVMAMIAIPPPATSPIPTSPLLKPM